MFCTKCGTQLEDNVKFCPNCGNAAAPREQTATPQTVVQPVPAAVVENPAYGGMKMGWYKFIIYFSLFAGAVLNFVNIVRLLSGDVYGGEYAKKVVYAYYDGLEVLDMCFIVASCVIIALQIYTRFRLAGFKKNAVKCLHAVYVLSMLVTVIYNLVVGSMADINSFTSYVIGNIAGTAIALGINISYFGKRAHLFVND